MDVYNLALTVLAWLGVFHYAQKLCSSAVHVLQFSLVTRGLSGYFNTLRELRLVQLVSALDELVQEAYAKEAMLSASCHRSSVEALLEIRLELDNLLKLVQDHGPNAVWSIVYGFRLDALLAGFEETLAPAGNGAGLQQV